MKKAVLEVGGMLSVLDFLGVEKQLKRVPGVRAARSQHRYQHGSR